jgi:hypothetical protein
MPLTLMRNFEAPPEASDNYVLSGELRVGRIYQRVTIGRPEFLWAINGVFGGPNNMRIAGMATTFDGAQAAFQENWEKWLAWARLQEIGGSNPAQPRSEPLQSPDSRDS